jgi:hypothetical protein
MRRVQNVPLHAILPPLPTARKSLLLRKRVLAAKNLLPKFKKKTLKRRERAARKGKRPRKSIQR